MKRSQLRVSRFKNVELGFLLSEAAFAIVELAARAFRLNRPPHKRKKDGSAGEDEKAEAKDLTVRKTVLMSSFNGHATRSRMRSLALRERGLDRFSSSDGTTGFFVTM
jgi:hypothetical protein